MADTTTPRLLATRPLRRRTWAVACAADGALVLAGSEDGVLSAWRDDLALETILERDCKGWQLVVHPDGLSYAHCGLDYLAIHASDGSQLAEVPHEIGTSQQWPALSYTGDGRCIWSMLPAGGSWFLRVHDARTGELVSREELVPPADTWAFSLTSHPEGRLMFLHSHGAHGGASNDWMVSDDGDVRFILPDWISDDDRLTAWSPTGDAFATLHDDGRCLRVRRFPGGQLIRELEPDLVGAAALFVSAFVGDRGLLLCGVSDDGQYSTPYALVRASTARAWYLLAPEADQPSPLDLSLGEDGRAGIRPTHVELASDRRLLSRHLSERGEPSVRLWDLPGVFATSPPSAEQRLSARFLALRDRRSSDD